MASWMPLWLRHWVPAWTIRLYFRAASTTLPALEDVVADRLLDVDVLARLAGPDRRQRVPVVRRGDRDGVDLVVVEDPAEVLDVLRLGRR